MSVQNIYSLYDTVDCAYTQPFYFARTDASIARQLTAMFANEAKRAVERGVSAPDINEYRLYKLATFDDSTGELVPVERVVIPFNAKEDL